MQRGFTKLFNTIVTSTIWQEDDKTRIVWITMLAISDPYGIVSASIPGLASVSNVSVDATRTAVKNLLSPDPDSRTRDFEGRRIEEIDGGWRILNYVKYRKMLSEAERAEYKAKWIRDKRRQMSTKSTNGDGNGQKSTVPSASSSVSFWEELKRNPLYKGVDVEREFEKAKQWCKRKRRNLTKRFFEGWLEKADRVLIELPPSKPNYLPPVNIPTEAEWEAAKKIAADEKEKFRTQINR